jgi:hypothetical protein
MGNCMDEADSLPPIHTVDLSCLISAIENRRKHHRQLRSSSPSIEVSCTMSARILTFDGGCTGNAVAFSSINVISGARVVFFDFQARFCRANKDIVPVRDEACITNRHALFACCDFRYRCSGCYSVRCGASAICTFSCITSRKSFSLLPRVRLFAVFSASSINPLSFDAMRALTCSYIYLLTSGCFRMRKWLHS